MRFVKAWAFWQMFWVVISLALWVSTGSQLWAGAFLVAAVAWAVMLFAVLLDKINPKGW